MKLTTKLVGEHLSMSQQTASRLLREFGFRLETTSLDEVRGAYIKHLRDQASLNGASPERARWLVARASREELRLERDRRTLVDLDQVELEFGGLVTAAKVRLEVVGRRVRAEHPDVAPEVVSTVSRLIREALEELAGRDEAKELADGR